MFVVAGASSKTGRVVAETLLLQGKKVRVLVRDALGADAWRERGAEVTFAALEDGPALARAIEGATGFYALLPETFAGEDFHPHRRRMADAIAGAVKAGRVSHVVFLLPAARHEGIYPSFFPSADLAFPTVATRDVGKLAARCFSEPPAQSEVIDLVGPMYSVRQLAAKLGAALGRELRVVDVPVSAHVEVLTVQAGLPKQMAEAVAEMFACLASGRVVARGDRMVPGTTTLDEILPALLAARPSTGIP